MKLFEAHPGLVTLPPHVSESGMPPHFILAYADNKSFHYGRFGFSSYAVCIRNTT